MKHGSPSAFSPLAVSIAQGAAKAATRLRSHAPATPLVHSAALSARFGCRLLLKCEHLLPSGSFKFRGALNKLVELQEAGHDRGVVAASTGNHGAAVAAVGRRLGIPVVVHAPAAASPAKLSAIAAEGATIILHDADGLEAELAARAAADREGLPYVSPYNDRDVIAGQGSMAVEMLEQEPSIDAVALSVGGGGLLCGVGSVLAVHAPDIELVGAWPANANSLLEAMRAGRAVETVESPTLSDATAGGIEADAITIGLAASLAPTCTLAPEARIAAAMRMIAEDEHWIVEGAAGVALAGLENMAPRLRGRTVAVVLCGRNIAFDRFRAATNEGGERL